MPRNKSETEPTIKGASDAWMHVLRMDARSMTPPGDRAYHGLAERDKSFYSGLDNADINSWTIRYKLWRKTRAAQTEKRKCHATKVNE